MMILLLILIQLRKLLRHVSNKTVLITEGLNHKQKMAKLAYNGPPNNMEIIIIQMLDLSLIIVEILMVIRLSGASLLFMVLRLVTVHLFYTKLLTLMLLIIQDFLVCGEVMESSLLESDKVYLVVAGF